MNELNQLITADEFICRKNGAINFQTNVCVMSWSMRLDEACLCRLKGNDAFHLVDKILDDD